MALSPLTTFHYYKYHGLGNDYLVLSPEILPLPLSSAQIELICNPHLGLGSDGILLGPLKVYDPYSTTDDGTAAETAVQIYNPDGSEAEKSGNGLRIFTRHVWRLFCESGITALSHPALPHADWIERTQQTGQTLTLQATHYMLNCITPKGKARFVIHTKGGVTIGEVIDDTGLEIRVGMGQAHFCGQGVDRTEPITLNVGSHSVRVLPLSIGNPHCVVLDQDCSSQTMLELGPHLECHPHFPQHTNVQFMTILNTHAIRIKIWERGAGATLASGSSACAAACAALKLGRCRSPLHVEMEGGTLSVQITKDWQVLQEGAVTAVSCGYFDPQFLEQLGAL